MAVKAAKEKFTRQDIIDILQQNVLLYKDEPEFVDYIVNLALYLIDQAYTVSGERSGDLESVLADFQNARAARRSSGQVPKPAAAERPADKDSFLPDEDDLDDGAPTTNKMKLQSYDAVMKAPPPPQEPDDDFEHPTSKQTTAKIAALGNVPEGGPRPASSDIEDLSEVDEEPKTRQLRSVGILTPDAQGGLTDRKSGTSPKISIGEDKGRARIYKVVRSYSASKGGDTNCPICGTDTKGSSRCPSCGHIM